MYVLKPKQINRGLKATLWPSGDWSVGRASVPKSDGSEHPLEGVFRDESGYHRDIARTQCEWHPEVATETAYRMMDWAEACEDQPARSEYLARAALEMSNHAENGTVPPCDRRDYLKESGAPSSLGLSAVINSRSPRKKPGRIAGKPAARRGSKGITSYGKKMIRSGVTLIAERCDRRCLTFGTATLPALSPEDMRKVALKWSRIQNRFMEKITRRLKRRGLLQAYVVVTEIQIFRWEKWGQLGLHLHWVCQGRETIWSDWVLTPSEVAQMWADTLAREIGHSVDTRSAIRLEVPRTSPAKELSKYLSKGSKVVEAVKAAGKGDELPTAWWGASQALKREVKSRIRHFSSEVAEWMVDNAKQLRQMKMLSCYDVFMVFGTDTETGEVDRRWVGMTGYFFGKAAEKQILDWATRGINLSEVKFAVS